MLPFWAGWLTFGGSGTVPLLLLLMFTPSLATGIVVATVDRGDHWTRRLGLGVPDWRRLLWFLPVALAVPIGLSVAAPFVAAALGVYTLDLVNLSAFRDIVSAQLQASGGDPEAFLQAMPIHLVAALQILNVLIGAFINVVPAMGEELGWRGWLLPKLLPLGTWPALILSGALWGVWHAPAILLGYNYPNAPVLGVLLFTVFCMLQGILHGWMRLATGSVWPAALMHGALNASAGLMVILNLSGTPVDTVWVGLGVTGWIAPMLLIAALAAAGVLPPRRMPDLEPRMPAKPADGTLQG